MSGMRLVLVSCCAPCSAGAIQQLADGAIPDVDDFVVLFFNPNIFPETEYQKRMAEQIRYCEILGIKHVELEYDHAAWRDAVRGLEMAPERGARCSRCFEFRFARAVRWARENGYNAVASVLGVSRHKDQAQVDAAAMHAVEFATPSQAAPVSPRPGGGNYFQSRESNSDTNASVRTVTSSPGQDIGGYSGRGDVDMAQTTSFPRSDKDRDLCDVKNNSPRPGGGWCEALGGGPAAADTDVKYIPIKWDDGLRQKINRASDFYRQNYCGCEFSIRKV